MKYKEVIVGMKVEVRTVDDMCEEFGASPDGLPKVAFHWNDLMNELCGKRFIVTAKREGMIFGLDTRWNISADMIKPYAKEMLYTTAYL